MPQIVCYEQPLNERIRSLLRFEFLFEQIRQGIHEPSLWASRATLQGLFDLLTLTGRNEFKGDLLKELERHTTTLNRLRTNPQVHATALEQILRDIGVVLQNIRQLDTSALEAVRQSDFLNAVYKRGQAPGGACQFDLPALHHWLQQTTTVRAMHLQQWLEPFTPLGDGVALVLQLIRGSATPQAEIAYRGFFQSTLDSNTPYQLLQVFLVNDVAVFPEISSGRHRFTIRFMEQADPNQRATQSAANIPFELACCAI